MACRQFRPDVPDADMIVLPLKGRQQLELTSQLLDEQLNYHLQCRGVEKNLTDCAHGEMQRNTGCDLVGVACFEWKTPGVFELRSDPFNRLKGRLFIDGAPHPIRDQRTDWNEQMSDIVCDKITGGRATKTEFEEYITDKPWRQVVAKLECNDNKISLKDCSWKVEKDEERYSYEPVITCSPCDASDIWKQLDVLNKELKADDSTMDRLMTAIQTVEDWLPRCFADCPSSPSYPLTPDESKPWECKLSEIFKAVKDLRHMDIEERINLYKEDIKVGKDLWKKYNDKIDEAKTKKDDEKREEESEEETKKIKKIQIQTYLFNLARFWSNAEWEYNIDGTMEILEKADVIRGLLGDLRPSIASTLSDRDRLGIHATRLFCICGTVPS